MELDMEADMEAEGPRILLKMPLNIIMLLINGPSAHIIIKSRKNLSKISMSIKTRLFKMKIIIQKQMLKCKNRL